MKDIISVFVSAFKGIGFEKNLANHKYMTTKDFVRIYNELIDELNKKLC